MDNDSVKHKWENDLAYSVDDATAKFKWWVDNRGVLQAYANVTTRERKLIPTATRISIINAAPIAAQPVHDDVNERAAKWCDSNPYHEITTRELSVHIGCTPAVARRVIRDMPHYFSRLNQYKYEVRNYREERAHDKAI